MASFRSQLRVRKEYMLDKKKIIHSFFKDRTGVLATKHKKEEVIAPILEKELGVKIIVPENFDTDKYGTFTRDIERMGNQLEAARHKAEAAMDVTDKSLGFSSEGTFGSHPIVPFLPFNREIVLLLDRETGLEVVGVATTSETNNNHRYVNTFQEAYEFSLKAGFPDHGVVIKVREHIRDQSEMIKGITNKEELKEAFDFILKKSDSGEIFIETDMRALYNPKRMKNIAEAARDLVEKIYKLCPKCSWPGFELIERKKGLPCEWCGNATELILSVIYRCKKCGYEEERFYPKGKEKADPGSCQYCNP
ncbi:MAG: DUF6671 family protein [Halanaerobiales bacterium]